jgi:acetyltransferase-like isoleucine patch superfamily enzyme
MMGAEKYARAKGVKIGKGCRIASVNFGSEPYLIEIGDHVYVTSGVSFVTHDGGVWVFTKDDPGFDVFGRIKIGSNVYIGNNALILPGVTIGNNCVIGACSVVTKSIPDNTVAAGVPCRYICPTEEYHQRMTKVNMKTYQLSDKQKRPVILAQKDDTIFIKKNLLNGDIRS